jgi:MFS family permease
MTSSDPENTNLGNRNESTLEVFRIVAVRNILLMLFVSAFAAQALMVALSLQVYDITKRKLDLGWLGLAEFIPALLLVLVTGSVADHFDRRAVAAASFVGEVVVVAALLWYSTTNPTSTVPIFVLVVAWGCCIAFVSPSTRSLLPAAAPRPSMLPAISALGSIAWQSAVIIGPVVGAFAYKASPRLAYAIAAVGFALAVLLCTTISKQVGRHHLSEHTKSPRPTLRTAIEGLGVIRKSPILLGAVSLDLFAVLFGGDVALLPAIADERNWDKGSVGLLRAAGGAGAALVTIALAVRPLTRNVGRVLLFVVGIFGIATMVFGATHSLVVAFVAMVVLNGADSVSVFVRSTLVPLVTPPQQRGRVLAVEGVFIGASNELGAFESGVAGEALGTSPAIILGGAATLLIVALWWKFFRPLRDVDRFSDLNHVTDALNDPTIAPTFP